MAAQPMAPADRNPSQATLPTVAPQAQTQGSSAASSKGTARQRNGQAGGSACAPVSCA
ncbi:hypothetical protein D3C72_2415120 [compost metagenome]